MTTISNEPSMPKPSPHPTQEELSAYSLGQLPQQRAVAIDTHIGECQPCCETIVGLSSDDTFVGLLKEARQLPVDQTLDLNSQGAQPSTSHGDIPPELAEHPRYEIVRLIGKGGMGDVYKARHRKMERTVALKVINRGLVQKAEAVDRFHREVKTAAQLSHPNIVTSHDADQAGDYHFLVMEFVDGVDLSQIVKDQGALPVADACDYIKQAATGLQHAHECGMVHRDIKPHNLMVTADGTLKILDFGLASLAPVAVQDEETGEARGDLTLAGAIMGTPDFISPEQAKDARHADVRSDIYSLGTTLYFLLSGQPPFNDGSVMHKLKSHEKDDPDRLESVRDDIPDGLADIVSKMMAKDPGERFQTPSEVAEALELFACESKPSPERQSRQQVQPHGGRRRDWPLVAVASLLFAAIVAGIVFYIQLGKTTLRFEIDDPEVSVSFAGESISVNTPDDKAFQVKPLTEQKFVILRDGLEVETDSLTLRRGQKVVLNIDVVDGQIQIDSNTTDVQPARKVKRDKLADCKFSPEILEILTKTGQSKSEFQKKLYNTLCQAASIPNAQWEKLASSPVDPTVETIVGDPLSIVLLAHNPAPKDFKGFRQLTESPPKPRVLHDAISLSQDHGYVSVIQPGYIKTATLAIDAESKLLRGTVEFEAPQLYAGKVNFAMEFRSGRMKIVEFALPEDELKITLDEKDVWHFREQLPNPNIFQSTPVPGLKRLLLPLTVVDVSSDEKTALVVDNLGTDNIPIGVPRIWSLETNKELAKLPALKGFYLRFVSGELPLCIAGDHRRQQIRFWDLKRGAWFGDWIDHDLRAGAKPIFWPNFSPDGQIASIVNLNGEMEFWNLRTAKPVEIRPPADKPLPKSHAPKPFYERQFSSDGKYCFAAFQDKLYVIDPSAATTIAGPFPHQAPRDLGLSWPSVLYHAASETLVTIESSDKMQPSTLRFRSAKENWDPAHSETVVGKVGSVSFLNEDHVITGGLKMGKASSGGLTARANSALVPTQSGMHPPQVIERDATSYAFPTDGKRWVGMNNSSVFCWQLGKKDLIWDQPLPKVFKNDVYITYQLSIENPNWVVAQRKQSGKISIAAYSMKDGRLLLDKSGLEHVVHVNSTLAVGKEVFRYLPKISMDSAAKQNYKDSVSLDSVVEKLTMMKPDLDIPRVTQKGNRAPVILYTVDGEVLDGKPAAVCDIKGCRIAILGADISTTRTIVKSFNAWVAGSELEGSKAENLEINDAEGKVFFSSKYQPPKKRQQTQQGTLARCRFHNFEFTLSGDTLRPSSPSGVGVRLGSAGILILIDASTGEYTYHKMKPTSERVLLSKRLQLTAKQKELVVENLVKMKPDLSISIEKKPDTAPVLLYTVEGEVLEGMSAAICDIENCRIAILGADISTTRTRFQSLNLRVAGPEAKDQRIKDTQGTVFFSSRYQSTKQGKKAECRFHDFEFDLTNRHLGYGPRQPVIGHSKGTLWANPTNAGILILVDASTGKFTSHEMKPKVKRVVLPEAQKLNKH